MTLIVLVRHGQASAGTANYDRLSSVGQKQATLLGEHWHAEQFNPMAAFSGTLQRQQHTAELALQNAKLSINSTTLADLDEYDHRRIDNLFANGVSTVGAHPYTFEMYANLMHSWRNAKHSELDGTMTWQAFSERGWNAIQQQAQQLISDNTNEEASDKPIVFFTSAGVIASVLMHAMNLNFDRALDAMWNTRNASITTFRYHPERTRLVEYNNVSHLSVAYDKTLFTNI